MYVFQSSYLRQRYDTYNDVDISNLSIKQLFNDFIDGYIVLTHTVLKGTFYLSLENLREQELPLDLTHSFNDYLLLNHNKEFKVTKEKPVYIEGVVTYGDGFVNEFSINQIRENGNIDDPVPKGDKTNLLIYKRLSDLNHLYKRMVVSVNGFLHRGIARQDGVEIIRGGETGMLGDTNTVGILSFSKACDVRQLDITEEMIAKAGVIQPLRNTLLVKTGESLVGKSVMISIGGYLKYTPDIVSVISEENGLVKIDTSKLDILKMIYNSAHTISLEQLGIVPEFEDRNYRKVKIKEILSDKMLTKYFSLPQSFLLIVDSPMLHFKRHCISTTGVPTYYEQPDYPVLPLLDSQGRLLEYVKFQTEDGWGVKVSDDITKRRMYKTNIDTNLETVNAISPTYKWYHESPYFLELIPINKGK